MLNWQAADVYHTSLLDEAPMNSTQIRLHRGEHDQGAKHLAINVVDFWIAGNLILLMDDEQTRRGI